MDREVYDFEDECTRLGCEEDDLEDILYGELGEKFPGKYIYFHPIGGGKFEVTISDEDIG